MGGLDSNFYIVPVGDPESYITVSLSGPVAGKTVAFPHGTFIFQTTTGDLYSINTAGAITPGFPLDLGESSPYTSPALMSCHGIACVVDNSVYLVSEAGAITHLADFESEYGAVADIAFGDIDADESADIIVAGWDKIYAFTIAGSLIDPFPVELSGSWAFSYSPPVITDVLSDGTMEIVIGGHQTAEDYWGGIFVFRAGTGLLTNYPIAVPDTGSWIYSNIVPADVDGDTLAELCVLCADGYVRYANPDRGSTTIWEDEFYVSEGSLQSGLIMASMNGDMDPDFVFLSQDTGRIVRRQPDGFNADDSLDYLTGDTYRRQSPIIFELSDSWFAGAASSSGNLNLWQMEEPVPDASYKWLYPGCGQGGTYVNPEPPVITSVRDNGESWTVQWSRPLAYGLPVVSSRIYIDPVDPDEQLDMIYEGLTMHHTFETEADSQTIYITAIYSNGSESRGRAKLLLPGEGIEEIRPDVLSIAIYPNPFNGSTNITSESGIIEIFDNRGRLVAKTETQGSAAIHIDRGAGVYHAVFTSHKGEKSTAKLLYLP